MKNLRKVLAVAIALVLVLGTALPVMAATSAEIETYAANLYNLGLYAGTSSTEYLPALDSPLTREQAFVLYAKIMGKAAKVAAVTADQIKAYLTDVFIDAGSFSEWAKPYATVLIMDKDISGRGDFTMGPQDIIKGNELGVLMLKALKIPVDYSTSVYACVTLWNNGIITFAESAQLNDIALTRGDALTIFWKTIANGKIKNGEYVAKDLVNKGVMSESAARAVGLLATYDAATAAAAATAATTAAENAVKAVEAAPYATQANYDAYVTLLADAQAKVALAPTATQAGFNQRLGVKIALIDSVISAQVNDATLAVQAYEAIASVPTIEASLAAIAKKDTANAKIAAIYKAALRVPLQTRVDAKKAVLEATLLLDVTSGGQAAATVRGDGLNQVLLTLQLKDAFGNILTSAPATNVTLSVKSGDVDISTRLSNTAITLYNGVAEVLFTSENVGGTAKTATVTATVNANNYAAGASDTLAITESTEAALTNPLDLASASMAAGQTDRVVITSKNDIVLSRYVNSNGVPDADITFSGAFVTNDVDKIIADPASAKSMIVILKKDLALNYVSGTEYEITVVDNMAAKTTKAKFKPIDTQIPYITSAVINSANYRQIKLTFSEAVNELVTAAILLNGSITPSDIVVDNTDRKIVVVSFANYVATGATSISVAANSFKDFTLGANVNATQTMVFDVPASGVTVGATLNVLSPKLLSLVLNAKYDTFDLTKIKVEKFNYDTATWEADAGAYPTVAAFGTGKTTIRLEGVAAPDNYFNKAYRVVVDADAIVDAASGVKNAKITLPFTIAKDETKPLLSTFEVNKGTAPNEQKTIKMSFSEPISTTPVVKFRELKADGTVNPDVAEIVGVVAADDAFRKAFTVTADLLKDKKYKATITTVSDDVGNAAATIADQIFESTKAATVAAAHKVLTSNVEQAGANVVITLTFEKDLTISTSNSLNALFAGNYRVAGAYLPANTVVSFGANVKTVVITVLAADVDDYYSEVVTISEFMLSKDGTAFANLAARQIALPAEP